VVLKHQKHLLIQLISTHAIQNSHTWAPIGRLDKDTEGLILLSNDGVLAKVLTERNSTVEKEYLVTTREDVMPVLLRKWMMELC
jgi:pseudouridine synthase